jgi:hypothetical protein
MTRHECPGDDCQRCLAAIAAREDEQAWGSPRSQRDLGGEADRAAEAWERDMDRQWGGP